MKRKVFSKGIASITAVFMCFTNIFGGLYSLLSLSVVKAEDKTLSDYSEPFFEKFPDEESYIAYCISNGMYNPATEETADYKLFDAFLKQNYTYDELAHLVIDNESIAIASSFYQVTEALITCNLTKLRNLSSKEMYELIIMEYLQYNFSSTEYKSNFEEDIVKYSLKLSKNAFEKYGELKNDKEYFKKLSFDDRLSIVQASRLCEDMKPYMTVIEDINKFSTTLEDFQKNISRVMAIVNANEERIQFLKEIRKKANGNTELCSAIDHVISLLNNSAAGITIETIEQGEDLTVNWAWSECRKSLKKVFPELEYLEDATDGMNFILNSSDQSSNNIRIMLLYTLEQYGIQAAIEARGNYDSSPTKENAVVLNQVFSAYMLYITASPPSPKSHRRTAAEKK